MNSEDISFLHISDTHLGKRKDFTLYGQNTFQITTELFKFIENINTPVDFVIHTGDVLNFPEIESADLAKSVFSVLSKPLFIINGNHDSANLTSMLQTGKTVKIGYSHNSGYFTMGKHAFLLVDAQGPPGIDSRGIFTKDHESDIIRFFNEFDEYRISIFIHFPPVPLHSLWADKEMLLANGDSFHKLLAKNSSKITGVFFGHLHHRVTILRDNILYSGAPSPFCNFGILPTDKEARFESDASVSCNYITLSDETVTIKEITFDKPKRIS